MRSDSYCGTALPSRGRKLRRLLIAAVAVLVAFAMIPMAAFAADPLTPGGGGAITTTVQDNNVAVTWTDATGGAGGYTYQIYASTGAITTTAEAITGEYAYQDNKWAKSSPGIIIGLEENTDYYVTVYVKDSAGADAIYQVKQVTTDEWHFHVYEKFKGTDAPAELKSYSSSDLAALAAANTSALGFMQYATNNSAWTIYGTKTYVKIPDLLLDAGATFADANDQLEVYAPDGFGSTFSYAQYTAGQYFYPATTQTDLSLDGKVQTGSVLALKWQSGPIDTTAGVRMQAAAEAEKPGVRFFIGLSDTDYQARDAGGSRLARDPSTLTVTHDYSLSDLSDKIADQEKQIATINDQLAAEQGKNTTLDADNKKLTDEKTQLSKEKTDLEAQKKDLETQKTTLEAQKAELQKQLDTASKAAFKNITAGVGKVTAGKKKATVTWKKIANAQSYQIVYATNKSFAGKKTVTVKSATTVKKTITKLKKGKTYYFKVRGSSKVAGATVYTKYSPAKKVKIKK